MALVLFSSTGCPAKQREELSEEPKTRQKAVSDCQASARVEEFEATGAPLSEGVNGESAMPTSLQELHTAEQNPSAVDVNCFDENELDDDDDDSVELHRTGIDFSAVKSSAEKGSQF